MSTDQWVGWMKKQWTEWMANPKKKMMVASSIPKDFNECAHVTSLELKFSQYLVYNEYLTSLDDLSTKYSGNIC